MLRFESVWLRVGGSVGALCRLRARRDARGRLRVFLARCREEEEEREYDEIFEEARSTRC